MKLPHLEIRIQQLLDDELTEEQFVELETELLENPAAMELYLSYCGLDSDLSHHSSYQEKAVSLPIVPVEELLVEQRRRAIRASMLSAAAVLTIIAVILWSQHVPDTPGARADFRIAPGSEFTLAHDADDQVPAGNSMAENSRLVLRHGVVELNLPHDVRAVIEAPADVALRDHRTLELNHGRAYFKVSSAEGQGFTVVTPSQRIVDLGTAFGIDCRKGKAEVELHVLEGSVRIDSLEKDKGEVINAPRAVLLSGARTQQITVKSTTDFLTQLPPKVDFLLDENFEDGLVASRDYVIEMDSTVVRDLAGNRFEGIGRNAPWRFTTASAAGTVRNFSFEQNAVAGGKAVAHWHEVTDTKASFNTIAVRTQMAPTHGDRFLMVDGSEDQSRVFIQDLGSTITAGTTYKLLVDVGSIRRSTRILSAQGFIKLYGSDAGYQSAIAATIVSPPADRWLRDQALTFTATEAHATGQTLGIALGCTEGRLLFDNVRLIPVSKIRGDATSIPRTGQGTSPAEGRDSTPPGITNLHPTNNSTGVSPGDHLIITFDEPIQLGTGRIFLRGGIDQSHPELVVGDPRISVDDRNLIIVPPADIEDGTTQMGRIHGWDSNGSVGIFNPEGKGEKYDQDEMNDREKSRGVSGAMHGPVMATLSSLVPATEIRRNIGNIAENHHYSVSAAIGVRAENTGTSSFPGYTIRLISGDTTLAELSGNTPPGPASSVNTVGFSWESSLLPDGIEAGDPLSIAISPNQSGGGGFLDIDNVRVSAIGQSGEK